MIHLSVKSPTRPHGFPPSSALEFPSLGSWFHVHVNWICKHLPIFRE